MCKQCDISPVYEFTNKRKLCKNCFIEYFQKKALYTVRKFRMISNGDRISYKMGNDFRTVVLKDILALMKERTDIEIGKSPSGKNTKLAIPSTLDMEADEITSTLIKKKFKELNKISPTDKKIIKPLYLFLDEEVLLYAKLRNLKFKKTAEKKDKISVFIDSLEKKHPEIKRAIVNSYLKIYNLEE
jgi:hypothetical protein